MPYFIPCKTVNEGNARTGWRTRAKRIKHQRVMAHAYTDLAVPSVQLPIVITMTRVGARKLDSDGVPSALKAIRDGIADALGIDDGRDDLIEWRYAQEFGARLTHGVRVSIQSRQQGEREWTTVQSTRIDDSPPLTPLARKIKKASSAR